MRSLGKVVNFSPKGSIVVRATMTPRIGQFVVGRKGEPIGRIIRITGPVSSPYILVEPAVKEEGSLFRLAGKPVFMDDRPQVTREGRPRRNREIARTPGRSAGIGSQRNTRPRPDNRPRDRRPPGQDRRDHGRRKRSS